MDSNKQKLATVILAAGKGTRMKNPSMAKVMAELAGKPLIGHVADMTRQLGSDLDVAVVGYKKEAVIEFLSANYDNIEFAEQNEQLGTGHAVAQAESALGKFNGNVLILCGDVPLLKAATLEKFIKAHTNAAADVSVLSTIIDDPTGYGRIVRDADGQFTKISEQKDATEEEKLFKEINSGVYVLSAEKLFTSLKQVSNSNAQGEYYLTDIIAILRDKGATVKAFPSATFDELQGINSPEDLRRAEAYYLKTTGI